MEEITQLLQDLNADKTDAASRLIDAVYEELRKMAATKMADEKFRNSLDATGLVHEAFLKLGPDQEFATRRHFFGAASQAMRRILIDRARVRQAEKRGGDAIRVDLDPDALPRQIVGDERLIELSAALNKFETIAPDKAELVRLRYFVGLTILEAAEILGISTATADRHWAYAKSWLQAEVQQEQG